MAFHSYTQLIQKLFNAYWCGPPSRVTGTSPWPCVDHSVSRLPPPTRRPLQARFHCGCAPRWRLTSPATATRRLIMQKARRHRHKGGSDRLQAHGFRNYFTPLVGVLFTFPSRYSYTIGLTGVFSLAGWSRRIHTGFHVPRATQDTGMPRETTGTELSSSAAPLSSGFPSIRKCNRPVLLPRHGPQGTRAGLGCSPFARHYWGNHCCFLFLGVLRCFSSPRSPPRP